MMTDQPGAPPPRDNVDASEHIRIAMIDDSELELSWTKSSLRPHGFEVLTFNRSIGIQAFIASNLPDLVLMDVNMPALDGSAACVFLKQNPETRKIPLLLYSSLPEAELKVLASRCKADGYIVKNHNVDSLVTKLRLKLAKDSR